MRVTPLPASSNARLAEEFRLTGTVSLAAFLDDRDAQRLHRELASAETWVEIFRAGDKVYEMPAAAFAALDRERRQHLETLILDAARAGLQYRYRAIRVAEAASARAGRGAAIDAFADLLNTEATRSLLAAVTGIQDVVFADAQATDYRAGDFLTSHDDDLDGKHRRLAYVYGLTPRWQADWGGLLLFERGDRVTGYVPDFNVLRLFAVPSAHHVSYVAPWVQERRLSITGWLRAQAPDQTGS